MIGQTLSRYQVLEKLGEGGMGVVYRGLDVRLNRPVAIKVLTHDATADADRARRFMQEARAASALNHPHIITVYDIGVAPPNASRAGPADFIVMEFVTGSTLEHVIGRCGLTVRDALKYAVQIADALAAAHRAGIVHRDLKPGNVMITERGDAKVLDFGLAKLTEHPDEDAAGATTQMAAARTEAGTILGTVAYMSPEQAEGKTVDARSDIFSFGSLLYEMVTGRRAFQGETKMSTLSAILQNDPGPASEHAKGVPRELDGIIAHCLRKEPDRRFQHLDDVQTLLDGLREGSATKVEVGRHGWRVGARLHRSLVAAAAVLLMAAATGVAWRFVRHREPAPAAAPPAVRLSSGGPASGNAEANRYFESAMQFVKVNYDVQKAQQMLDRALELDAHFAEARAWKALTNFLILDAGYANDSALLNQAEAEIRRALEDDSTLARAHVNMAAVYLMQGRRELMPAELDQALNANANDEDALFFLMQYHYYGGDYVTAQALARRILGRLPLFWPARFILGYMLVQQGDLAGAIDEHNKILQQDAQNVPVLGILARAYLGSDDLLRSRQSLERVPKPGRQTYYLRLISAILLAKEGRRDQALKDMDEQVLKWGALVAYMNAEVAAFYAVVGDAPKALEWLNLAVRNGDDRAEWFRRDPLLANIRDHPRFEQIMQSITYRRQQRKPPR